MSISSEIERIQTAKSAIITSIENKGVTVPTGAMIDELPELIDSIPSGGGGGDSFFKKSKYAFLGNFGVDVENKIFRPFVPSSLSGGGGFCVAEDNLDGFEKLLLKIVFNKVSSGGSGTVVGYQSRNSSYTDGRIFLINTDISGGHIIWKVASSTTSWREYIYSGFSSGINKIEVEVEKISTNYKITFKLNDVEKYNSITPIYNAGFFCPTFFMSNFYIGNRPSYLDLYSNEYIDMTNTSLIIDGEKFFGL